MKLSECDILILPGLGGSKPGHWQLRWAERMSSAAIVEQADWFEPDLDDWVQTIDQAARLTTRPIVLIAHSLAVTAVAHAAPRLPDNVRGAFLVAPTDVELSPAAPEETFGFRPVPRDPLPFPSLLVASRNDPYCAYDRAEDFAYSWGAALVDAGESGHINVASGHGPWPEGLMRLAGFLKGL